MTKASPRSPFIVRFLSGCAVLACIVQWTWTLLVLAYPFLHSSIGTFFLPPKPTTPQPVITPLHLPNSIELIIMIVVVALALFLSVMAFVWVPREASKTTENASRKTAETIIPIITHHQKLSPKKSRQLTARIVWWLKFALIIVPFVLLLPTLLFPGPVDTAVALVFGFILLIITLFWGSLALIAARLLP